MADGGILSFKGIRYGAPTSGARRFRAPVPPPAWTAVHDALAYPPMSPQIIETPIRLFSSWTYEKDTSEDCLALNVWTPALRDGGRRPVMVWFHGGDFASLSGSRNVFDGTRLSRKGDVVVVTLNHRLNVFGFLYLGGLVPEYPDANVGLLDLVLALRWVQKNIAEFGGDPGNVTIAGQSGGGGKVSTLMAMPAAAGLFHRAIVQSGSYARTAHLQALDPDTATASARHVLASLGIEPAKAARVLPDLSAETLVAGLAAAARGRHGAMFRPVADGRVLPSGPWWPQAPAVSAHVPLLTGTNATEMTTLLGLADPSLFDLDEAGLRHRLSWVAADRRDDVIAAFRASRPEASPSDVYWSIATAAIFRRGAWTQAGMKAAQPGAAVYLYEIDWATPVDGGKWRTPHSMDLPLVFDNVAMSDSLFGAGREDAQRVADQVSAAWLAFMRTGDPRAPGAPAWPPYTPDGRTTMVFDVSSGAVDGFRDDERQALEGQHMVGLLD